MKRIVLVAIGAKFIHSSLALKYLRRFEDNDKKHHSAPFGLIWRKPAKPDKYRLCGVSRFGVLG